MSAAPIPPDVLLDPAAVVAAWEQHVERTGLAPASKQAYIAGVRGYLTWLEGQAKHAAVEVFADPHIRDYAVRDYVRWMLTERQPRRKPKGVDLVLTGLGSLYGWVGLGPPNVTSPAAPERHAPKALTVEQVRDLFRAAERRGVRDLALIALAVGTGLRVAEIAALNDADALVTARKGHVDVRYGKGGKARRVPMNPQTRDKVDAWKHARLGWLVDHPGEPGLFVTRAGRRLAVRTINHTVGVVGVAAGIDGLSPHALRHTYGTMLTRAGVDVVVVAELMGHASMETTRQYARPSEAEADAAVDVLQVDY